MKVYKKLSTNYTVSSNEIFNHDLSFKAIGIYLYILSKPDGWEFSIKGIISQSKEGKDSVTSGIKELESKGFLIRKNRKNDIGQFSGSDWEIYDKPTENSDMPMPEKSPSENPQQVNTNTVSNKLIIYTNILNFWNTGTCIKHKFLPKGADKAIDRLLKEGNSMDEIVMTIWNYFQILESDEYFFKYKWSLTDFLNRGYEKFKDFEIAKSNFRSKNSQSNRKEVEDDVYSFNPDGSPKD